MSKKLDIKIFKTKGLRLRDSVARGRHCLDHDRLAFRVGTRLDVTGGLWKDPMPLWPGRESQQQVPHLAFGLVRNDKDYSWNHKGPARNDEGLFRLAAAEHARS
jgi:hypothetical protein